MATFEHEGVTLAYDDNGGSGSPAFVFIHGWTCDRSFFAPQFEHFGRDHRAIAVDLRGHGESSPAKDGDYAVETFASDVAALIDHLDLGPAVVVGHSLGGVITTQLAASRPDLVAAAVLVDPAPLVMSAELRPIVEGLFARIAGPDGEQVRAGLVEGMFLATDDSDRKAAIVKTMAAVPHDIASPAIGGLLSFDGPAALAAVTRPIASIGADGPINDEAAMKAINPSLVVGQTLGSGHFNQLEVPNQINAMIEQFLKISA
jgi:pimeloyl-ACP methyl ester carboxylesterase